MRTETSFDEIDNETARSQYNSWAARKSETLDEFMMRKRKIELNNLVRMVIDKELTEQEKEIVGLHWYGGKSVIETAEALGMSKSLISKKISKINDKIYDKLKYALEFRFGSDFLGECRVIIKSKAECPVAAGPASTARRIKQLRLSQAMTLGDVSEMTGIDTVRLEKIESSRKEATSSELAKIACAFRTSADYIIFGEKERMCC